MSQETEYWGKWWLPSEPERQMTGHLDLSGSIHNLTLDAPLLPIGELEQDFPVIHGLAREGFDLTLLGAYSIRDWPIGNWYAISDVVVGAHLDPTDATFTETAVVFDHLAAWVPARGIETKGTGRGEPGEKALEITYTIQAPLEGRLTDGTDVQVSTSAPYGHSLKSGVTLNYAASVRWKYRQPLTTRDIVSDHVVPFQEVVAWAVQKPVTVSAAYLRAQPDGEWHEWRRRWRKAMATDEESPIGNIRLWASDLGPTFAEGLQRWLEVLRGSQDAIDLMVSLLFSAPEYADTDVLLVAQSLEAYHRATLQKDRWPREIFEQRQQAVLARFNDEEDGELKKWLDEVLEFANEPTLSERLRDLHNKVEPVLGDLLALRPQWADLVKKMRNTYTHRGKQRGKRPEKRRRDYEPDELKEMARLGRLVFDVCLMLDLGLSVDTCRERVQRWSDYSWAMHDARKRRTAPQPLP
ncbi:MAG TPA: HEPN domain-containing protein [Candidatus Saccharimonadales bacterium]|nr:HEPN domain-containing protein [Candidatus Saccharimonadales bacterium]